MPSSTVLKDLLNSGKFEEARLLLQRYLSSGELIDPRLDSMWARIADEIGYGIQKSVGWDEAIRYWESLLEFFLNSLEPSWGHCHKGHIYFRLGFSSLRKNFDRARNYFESAYKEDVTLETAKGGT